MSELGADQFLRILPCNCGKFTLTDKDHGHILTGDLRVIKSNKLRASQNVAKIKTTILVRLKRVFFMVQVNVYLSTWCNKKGMPEESLSEGKHLVNVELKINTFEAKYVDLKTNNNMLHSEISVKCLLL